MKRTMFRTLTVLAALSAGLVPAVAAAADDVTDHIDTWITERMEAHGIPGAAVAVIEGGETIHLRGYGHADRSGRPVTEQTPFLIGSTSKPFTANVVLHLVEEGVLSLDERVLPYLAHLVDDPPAGFEQVTIRQLLNHTSGLAMTVGVAGAVEVHDTDDALQRRVVEVLEQPLAFAPGARFGYSNAGPTLLAAVVEEVTGQPLAQALTKRIFDPLGMTDTFATATHPGASRLATGHRLWFGRWRPAELPYDPAGVAMGYIGLSARDLASFLHAHLDDDPSVAANAAQVADSPVVATGGDVTLEAHAGLGWFLDHLGGHRVVSHAGSLGHFTTHLIMVPDAGIGIAVATNASAFAAGPHESQYDLSLGVLRLMLELEPEPADRSVLMTVAAPTLVWALIALLIGAAVRHVSVTLPRWQQPAADRRRWVLGLVLPTVGYAVLGTVLLLAVPLGAARHFAPDIGWGATILAYLSITWALARTAMTINALRSARTSPPPLQDPSREPPPPTPRAPTAVPPGTSVTAR
jgi:CubicO group peptidase (beta-lactamase class C family)